MPKPHPNTDLRARYVAFLAQYGLEPRRVEDALRDLLETADSTKNDAAARDLQRTLASLDPNDPPTHPAQMILEAISARVEATIALNPREHRPAPNVYVGEFPIGSVNAFSTPVPGGFLALLDSGLIVAMKQVLHGIALEGSLSDADITSTRVVDTLAAVLRAYTEYGDPFYGPWPLAKGPVGWMAEHLVQSCHAFVVGHEYAHVVCGHFDSPTMDSIPSKVGKVTGIHKNWAQEFEADIKSYQFLREAAPDPEATGLTAEEKFLAARTQDTIQSTPFVALQILGLFEEARARVGKRVAHGVHSTHPPIVDRQRRLAERFMDLSNLKLPATMAFMEAIEVVKPLVLDRINSLTYPEFLTLTRSFDEVIISQRMTAATESHNDATPDEEPTG